MRSSGLCWLALGMMVVARAAIAQADAPSSDEVPGAILEASDQASAADDPRIRGRTSRRVWETALTIPSYRGASASALPDADSAPSWRARTDLDMQESMMLADAWSLTIGNRFNLQHAKGGSGGFSSLVRNDLRELYVTRAQPDHMLDIGRINIRGGVAAAYNPTDYFRERSVVERVSLDPSVLRENRLGTVALRAQKLYRDGALMAVISPRLKPRAPTDLNGETGLNPQLGRTNASSRVLLRGNYRIAPDFDPEISLFSGDGETQLGLSLTRAVSERITAYVEWSGGRRESSVARAYGDGVDEGRFPPNFRPAFPYSSGKAFRSDLALGFTAPLTADMDFATEYSFHQAGFSSRDWRNWFALAQSEDSRVQGQLSYIRAHALDLQEPLGRHYFFTRFEWRNALARDVTLVHLNMMNLQDHSSLQQLTLRWDVLPNLSLSVIGMAALGASKSEHGSGLIERSLLFSVAHYF
jgi:hypothetical protein